MEMQWAQSEKNVILIIKVEDFHLMIKIWMFVTATVNRDVNRLGWMDKSLSKPTSFSHQRGWDPSENPHKHGKAAHSSQEESLHK